MTDERIIELKELIWNLERRIRPLNWDAGRNQINEYKKQELAKLQTEHGVLEQELQELERKSEEL
jgi:hypothetical protein